MRSSLKTLFAAFVAVPTVLALSNPLMAQPVLGGARGVMVEGIDNKVPAFMVRVDVDHADRVYQAGDQMKVNVKSEKPGYLYLFYCDAAGQVSCLFPNKAQADNQIPADKVVEVPGPNGNFALKVTAPFGREDLKAVVSLQPLKSLDLAKLTQANATPLTESGLKGVQVEVNGQPSAFAEHHVQLTTVERASAPSKARRVGVFIGISDFATVNDLQVSHKDAQVMAEVMKQKCGLDDAAVLINQQATLANIERAVRQVLPSATKPGDTVFLYWSGHGGRCADDNRDEADGYDEFLVPYDGSGENLNALRRTMLLDDTFGRWVQALDGRKLVVILDTCHSGGQATGSKGMSLPGISAPEGGAANFDFLDGELERSKDIGQKETAILASSRATQVSFETEEGLSAMTLFLAKQLSDATTPITLAQVFDNLKSTVPAYVSQHMEGAIQTPVLVDHTTPPVYVKP